MEKILIALETLRNTLPFFVSRPMHVKVRAQNRFGEWFEVEGDGLTARCFCHEIDHLEGIVFTSKAERMLTEEELQSGEY